MATKVYAMISHMSMRLPIRNSSDLNPLLMALYFAVCSDVLWWVTGSLHSTGSYMDVTSISKIVCIKVIT